MTKAKKTAQQLFPLIETYLGSDQTKKTSAPSTASAKQHSATG